VSRHSSQRASPPSRCSGTLTPPRRHRRLAFYWIVYLYWIGAVPAVILLGLLVLPPAPRET
jgi:hypothetical protein